MKTTTINATQAPLNVTVQYTDITYSNGQSAYWHYSKNIRTGKSESIGVCPEAKLEKSGKAAMRFINNSLAARFTYRWDEFEGLISIDVIADDCNISICMHDDMEVEKAQTLVDTLISSAYATADEDGRVVFDHGKIQHDDIVIELWGKAKNLVIIRDDLASFADWLKIIG